MNVFQGTKRVKEQEQMIAGQQEKLQELDQSLERIAGAAGTAMNILETIEQEQDRFDKALTPVVGYIRQIQAAEMEYGGKEDLLRRKLTLLASEQEDTAGQYHQAAEEIRSGSRQALSAAEEGGALTGPACALTEAAEELDKSMDSLGEGLAQMEELGRQMGVISLNAAIEAGRMGDSGRKFVGAAEEVRVCAGKYQSTAEELKKQAEELKKQLSEAREKMASLSEQLKGQKDKATEAADSFAGGMERLERAEVQDISARLNTFLKEWEEALTAREEHGACYEEALTHMEQAGECFMNEQQFLTQLREQWEKVRKETGDREQE